MAGLRIIVEWCSAKIDILQKAVLKDNSSKPLVNFFEKQLQWMFCGRVASVKPAILLKSDFIYNYFSRIKTSGIEQLFSRIALAERFYSYHKRIK